MRRYDEQVDVRRADEAPSEFLWRGRLWQVRAVVSHWVETGPWWTSPGVRAVVGAEGSSREALEEAGAAGPGGAGRDPGGVAVLDDLLAEQEVWRVEAHCPQRQARPRLAQEETGFGVFDLVFSWTTGCWRLTGCVD